MAARPHGAALVRSLARALLVAAVGAALVAAGVRELWLLAPLGVVVLALAAIRSFRAVVAWDRTRHVLTDERLVVEHGFFRRRAAEVELAPGAAVEVEQSLAGRVLGYGTLVAGELEIPYVADPRAFARSSADAVADPRAFARRAR